MSAQIKMSFFKSPPNARAVPNPSGMRTKVAAIQVQAGNELAERMKRYPPPTPRYVRTGNLRRGWQLNFHGLDFELSNAVEYAGLVQGFSARSGRRPRQRPLFAQIGWSRLDEERQAVREKFEPRIMRILQGRRRR
ncbi:MAG: hypothetical protein ACOC9T_01035 [Myxococcota bacterium]